MNIVLFKGLKESYQELRLIERFPTRNSDTTTRILVKQAVLHNLTDNFFNGHVLAAANERLIGTCTNTCQTLITFPPVNDPLVLIIHRDCASRTGLCALPASLAPNVPHQKRPCK